MIAIQGMYDGKTIKLLDPIHAHVNTRVIIMFSEDQRSPGIPATRLEEVAIEQGAQERKS